MPIFIVDSSVIVKWLHHEKEQNVEQAEQLLDNALRGAIELFAPELAKYEIGNALLQKKRLSLSEAKILLTNLYSLPIQFISLAEDLANNTYKIAQEAKITYYDASFMSLAKQYGATLVTDNVKHQGKDPGIKVVSLKDY